MQISNNYNQQNFGAVRLYPKAEDWSPRILNEVLSSKIVGKIIEADLQKGCDTRISFTQRTRLLPGHSGFETKTSTLRIKGSTDDITIQETGAYSLKNICKAFVERAMINLRLVKKLQRRDSLFFPENKNGRYQETMHRWNLRGVEFLDDTKPLLQPAKNNILKQLLQKITG